MFNTQNKIFGKKIGRVILTLVLAFALCGISFSTGCTNSTSQEQNALEQIKSYEYPNVVAESAQISDQYSDIAQKLTADNINYFLEITKIPHPSEHLDQIKNYLTNEFTKLGFSAQVDQPSGSLYVDIPASEACKNSPKVIIQSHMDMVPTVADDKSGFDHTTQGVNAVYDKESGEIHSDGQTNVGADDGVGIALTLSMAKNYKEYEHPAMRFLYTEDEEIGLVGASKLSPSVLDCDYLINYDGNRVGEIIVASAGTVNGKFTKTFGTENSTSSEIKIDISLNDLKGGHTADNVTDKRIHASHLALNCLNELTKNGISYRLSNLKVGTTQNSFPTSLDMQFYIAQDKVEEARSICEKYMQDALSSATDDVNAKLSVKSEAANTASDLISAADSAKIVSGLLNVPDGVIKMSTVNTDIPETSCALGVLKLENGVLDARVKMRSSNNDDINYYLTEFPKIAEQAGIEYVTTAKYGAFPDCSSSKLAKTILEGYKQCDNIEGFLNATHGGLELSHFRTLKPDMQMISIGSDVKDEHMCSETYYSKSQNTSTAALLYTITHLGLDG